MRVYIMGPLKDSEGKPILCATCEELVIIGHRLESEPEEAIRCSSCFFDYLLSKELNRRAEAN